MSRFLLGQVVITTGAKDVLHVEDVQNALARHTRGDWGNLCEEDKAENELSLSQGFRLLSAYTDCTGMRFWIITEGDRSATTILLPEEY